MSISSYNSIHICVNEYVCNIHLVISIQQAVQCIPADDVYHPYSSTQSQPRRYSMYYVPRESQYLKIKYETISKSRAISRLDKNKQNGGYVAKLYPKKQKQLATSNQKQTTILKEREKKKEKEKIKPENPQASAYAEKPTSRPPRTNPHSQCRTRYSSPRPLHP